MSLSTETSNLTLAYINTSNNVSQLNTNIRDISNNLIKINQVVDNLLDKLHISFEDISSIQSQLLDISTNLNS